MAAKQTLAVSEPAWSTIQTVIEKGKQIMGVIMSALSSIREIAAGNVAGAANFIERTIGNALPVVMSFAANLLGIGNIGTRIRNLVKGMRQKLGIDRVMNSIMARLKQIVGAGKQVAGKISDLASGLIPGGVSNTNRSKMEQYHKKVAQMALADLGKLSVQTNDPEVFTKQFKSEASSLQTRLNPYIALPARISINIPANVKLKEKIHIHIGPNDTDLYDPKEWRAYFENRYGQGNVESTTVANDKDRMIHMAGKRHPVTGVVYDLKGFPIFDPYTLVDLHISAAIAGIRGGDQEHYEEATRTLKRMIASGNFSSSKFDANQMKSIQKEKGKIEGYTWHHHQDFRRMQLVREYEHQKTGHLGGSKMWFGR